MIINLPIESTPIKRHLRNLIRHKRLSTQLPRIPTINFFFTVAR